MKDYLTMGIVRCGVRLWAAGSTHGGLHEVVSYREIGFSGPILTEAHDIEPS